MVNKKTKREIIEETKNFYCEDTSRRAVSNHGCYYKSQDGTKHCALGRLMINPQYSEPTNTSLWGSGCSSWDVSVDQELKEEYRGHENHFWANVQDFHDSDSYWNEHGLTKEGQIEYERLINEYGE